MDGSELTDIATTQVRQVELGLQKPGVQDSDYRRMAIKIGLGLTAAVLAVVEELEFARQQRDL